MIVKSRTVLKERLWSLRGFYIWMEPQTSYSMDHILTNIDGVVTKYALWFGFKASNNQAEYEALIARLKIIKDLGVKCLRVFINS